MALMMPKKLTPRAPQMYRPPSKDRSRKTACNSCGTLARRGTTMGLPEPLLEEMKMSEEGRQAYIRLNVGGTPFRLSIGSILKQGDVGFLYGFLVNGHEERLQLCDDFFKDTKEYFFERPAYLFEPIYAFYVTGLKHKPHCMAQEAFALELNFWGLTKVFSDDDGSKDALVSIFTKVKLGRLRKKIWDLVEEPESSIIARIIAFCSIFAIIISNTGLVLGTLPDMQANYTVFIEGTNQTVVVTEPHRAFEYIELACIAFFTVEYLTKIIVAPNRKEVFWKPLNLIDLIAIVPFYVELTLMIMGFDTRGAAEFQGAIMVIRILRVLRVVRLLKLGRYSTGLQVFVIVMKRSIPQLGMVLMVVAIGVMFFSTLVYFVEKDEIDTQFSSIPAAFWWCIVTITTVGYGDMFPQTIGGKLIASLAITSGLLVLSLPITIIVDHFMQVQDEMNLKAAKRSQLD